MKVPSGSTGCGATPSSRYAPRVLDESATTAVPEGGGEPSACITRPRMHGQDCSAITKGSPSASTRSAMPGR